MSSQKQSKQKGGEKQSFMGVVTRVISGETIEVRSNNELRTVHLAFITAPHFKRENAPEEKFAFEAREALRKKVIGKELKLVEEFVSANGTVFCIPFVGKSNVITYMLKTGYVVLRSKRESEEMKPYNDALEQAKTSKKGIFSEDKPLSPVVIKAVEFNSNNAGKTIPVIIEYVMSATDFRVQLKKRGELSVRLAGGFGVSSDLKEGVIAEEAKDFCKQYVQRDAEMTVFPNEQDNRVFVTIKINGVNIIEEIAKMGYLRLNNNLPKGFSTEDKNSIQAAQTEAQKAKKGMWVDYDYEAEAKKIQEIKDKKVARVHSSKNIKGHLVEIVGMGLVIDNGSEQKTVYIANCFVPFLKEGVNHLVKNKFYGDEMRDALRKALVGREVTCIFCYESFGKSERSEKRGYYDVLVNKKNIAIDLIKNGIADCGFTKIEENKSGNYDELVEAFEYAKSKKNGHHNPKQVVKQFIDTTVKKSSKDNEKYLAPLKMRTHRGYIDLVISPVKFKVVIPDSSLKIFVILSGTRSYRDITKVNEEAIAFMKKKFLLQTVNIEIDAIEKFGSFFGNLSLENGVELAEVAIRQGFASYSGKNQTFVTAELTAKEENKGIWPHQQSENKPTKKVVNHDQTISVEKKETIYPVGFDGEKLYYYKSEKSAEIIKEMSDKIVKLERVKFTGKVNAKVNVKSKNVFLRGIITGVENGRYIVKCVDTGAVLAVGKNKLKELNCADSFEPVDLLEIPLFGIAIPKGALAGLVDELTANVFNKPIDVAFVGKERSAILFNGEENLTVSLLKKGLVILDRFFRAKGDVCDEMRKAEIEGKEERVGVWVYGEIPEDNE